MLSVGTPMVCLDAMLRSYYLTRRKSGSFGYGRGRSEVGILFGEKKSVGASSLGGGLD